MRVKSLLRGSMLLPVVSIAALFCLGAMARAEGYDLRDLNLGHYAYPGSRTAEEVQEQYDAKLVMYSRDPREAVVEFYRGKGLKAAPPGENGEPLILEETVAPHVPLKVVIASKPERERLKDRDLYRNLEASVALGARGSSELDEVRRRFDGLKGRFYAGDPRAVLNECRKNPAAGSGEKKMSAGEQGRRLQELAMQGRMEELREVTEALMSAQQGMAAGIPDRWGAEVECLEKLEAESFPLEIQVTATRDDVLG